MEIKDALKVAKELIKNVAKSSKNLKELETKPKNVRTAELTGAYFTGPKWFKREIEMSAELFKKIRKELINRNDYH